RVDHGIYGYTYIDDSVKHSITNWLSKRHDWNVQSESLSFTSGVITSLHAAIQTLTEQGDQLLIQTPVYPTFYHVIQNKNREIVTNSLIHNEGGCSIYFVDFDRFVVLVITAFIF